MSVPLSDSLVSRATFRAILAYLVASMVVAGVLARPRSAWAVDLALTAVLLAGFLWLAAVVARRLAALDEFGKLLAWRAMAVAGLVAVWVELFLGALFQVLGLNLFIVIALGPPQFWLCAALFIRQAEADYARPRT